MEKVAYFDNAATTFPKPECVYNFTDQFYRDIFVIIGCCQYPRLTMGKWNHTII